MGATPNLATAENHVLPCDKSRKVIYGCNLIKWRMHMAEIIDEPIVLFALTVTEVQTVAEDRLNRKLNEVEIDTLLRRVSEIMQARSGWQTLLRNCVDEIELESEYKKWLMKVGETVWGIAGCSVEDLPDLDYYSLFIVGSTPTQAAKTVLINAGFGQNQ